MSEALRHFCLQALSQLQKKLPINSKTFPELDLLYTRCFGDVSIVEVLEHATMLTDKPYLQATCVAVDCSDCQNIQFRFPGMLWIVSKLRWDFVTQLTKVSGSPVVHFLVPMDGVYGQVRQFQEICGSFDLMPVFVHTERHTFHASISDDGLDYRALLQTTASQRSEE